MTLNDIIKDLQTRLQHTLTHDDIVRYINYALYDISDVASKYDVFRFNTFDGNSLYPIPSYIVRIKTVTVDGTEYLPKGLNESKRGNMYTITPDSYIQFIPAPNKNKEVLIAFEGVEQILTLAEVQETYPDLDDTEAKEYFDNQKLEIAEEYSQLIPLSVAISAAETMEDINLANNFRVQYNQLYKKAEQGKYIRRGKYPVTRVVQ